jgi:hypothetical protein
MTDAALENAMARRSQIASQLNNIANDINSLIERHSKLRGELDQVEGFIRMWHEMAGTQPPATLERKVTDTPAEGGKRIRPKNPAKEVVADACVNYIREANRPLMRSELLERLTMDGIIIRGKDPAMVLSTMLWRSKKAVTRLRTGGYWPTASMPPPSEQPSLEDVMG